MTTTIKANTCLKNFDVMSQIDVILEFQSGAYVYKDKKA